MMGMCRQKSLSAPLGLLQTLEEKPVRSSQTIRLQEHRDPPTPHHFPPLHESKGPSSPCQLTAGGKRGEQGAEGWVGGGSYIEGK